MNRKALARTVSFSIPVAFTCAFLSIEGASAVGTIDVFNDAGIHNPGIDGVVPDILTWAFSIVNIDANHQIKGESVPEGAKVAEVNVNTGWGGFGFFFVEEDRLPERVPVALDLSEFAGGELRFLVRHDLSSPLDVEMEYVAGGRIQKSGVRILSTSGKWQEIAVPLDLFPGLNLARLRSPFLCTAPNTGSAKMWQIDHVRLVKPVTALRLFPSENVRMHPGERRMFTVEGVTDAQEAISVYPRFEMAGSAVIEDAGVPQRHVFVTAGDANFALTAKSGVGEFLTETSVEIEVVDSPKVCNTFGLLSETHRGATLDSEIELITFPAHLKPTISESEDTAIEGARSFVTSLPALFEDEFTGWALEWVADGIDSIDLSRYLNGAIKFELKAPPELGGKMVVGIRSVNVPAGSESSTVPLSQYARFNDQWNSVIIPIEDLAGSSPFADLARMKSLFVIALTQATPGEQRFFIDNLRWAQEIGLPKVAVVRSIDRSSNRTVLLLSGCPGAVHELQRSIDLQNWTTLQTQIPFRESFEFTESEPTPKAFYRVRVSN